MTPRTRTARTATLAAALLVLPLVGGCSGSGSTSPEGAIVPPSPGPTSAPGAGTRADVPPGPVTEVTVTGTQDVVTGLEAPWGVALLPNGDALVTLRDRAQVVRVSDGVATQLDGPGAQDLATGTRTQGEGGLLGVAVQPDAAGAPVVFLYRTTPRGNEVVRGRLVPEGLSDLETVLDGIPASGNHNGGRIAFGPDGLLYVATGDAGLPSRAQDPDDLGGKILRITVDGDPAPDNPDPGSPVWSLGHRNVQGLGWAPDGTMFASEFGQNTWDELNVIEPGGNYGWPVVEGGGGERAPAARAARAARWPTTSTSSPRSRRGRRRKPHPAGSRSPTRACTSPVCAARGCGGSRSAARVTRPSSGSRRRCSPTSSDGCARCSPAPTTACGS